MNIKSLWVALTFAAALSVSPAVAQDATPSPRATDLATQYVALMDIERFFWDFYEASMEATPEVQRLMRENFGVGEKGRAVGGQMPTFIPESDREALRPMIEIMEGLLVETYAHVYSEAQLRELVRFYSSREGREIMAVRDDFWISLVMIALQRGPQIAEQLGFNDREEPTRDAAPSAPTRSMTPMQPSTTWPSRSNDRVQIITAEQWEAEQAAAAAH